MKDTELTADLAKAIVRAPGNYRFTVPVGRRENARDSIRRYASGVGATVSTRTDGDTMWVSVA